MKNIEKYKETKDALKAWEKYHDEGGGMLFAAWADEEYIEPRPPTLLEAAETVKNTWHSQWQYGSLSIVAKAISNLSDAIDREEALPVRNCDRYRTAKEAYDAFEKSCCKVPCGECRFSGRGGPCGFSWLYGEAADKEEAK